MDIVLFSFFIPVRDVVFSIRQINKYYKSLSDLFFKSVKNKKTK